MQINQAGAQIQGIANAPVKMADRGPVEPKDIIQINGENSPSISSIASQGISREFAAKILMKNNKVESVPLDNLPKLFHKSQAWTSESMHGTFSTAVVFSPRDKCYYTGMIGDKDVDKKEGKKYLTAFNEDGSIRWKYDKESITANPALDDKGNVYLRAQDSLIALDKDGNELWSCKAQGSSGNSLVREELHQRWYSNIEYEDYTPQILPDGTVCIMATNDGSSFKNAGVTAIKDGKVLWQSEALHSGDKGPRMMVKNGKVYVSKIESFERKKGFFRKETVQRDIIACLNADGSEKFRISPTEAYQDSWSCPSEARKFNVADDGSLYVMRDNKTFVHYSPDGEKLWEYESNPTKPGNTWMQNVPVQTSEGNIVLSSIQRRSSDLNWKTNVIELDSNGKELWTRELDYQIASEPKIASNGDMFFHFCQNDKKTEEIVQLNKDGHVINKISVQKGHEDIDAIMSFSLTSDGKLMVETLHSDGYGTWNHKREVSVLSTNSESEITSSSAGDTAGETGVIEKTDDFVIINGVKVPRNRK